MTRPQTAAPARNVNAPQAGPGRWMTMGQSGEKALDFKNSSLRLLKMLRPERALTAAVLFLGVASVTLADVVSTTNAVPGHGIDFTAVTRVLLLVLIIYIASSVLALFQARLTTVVVQRVVFRLRRDVEMKLSRLPLSYFDKQQRGEVLSRATNDTDNIAITLQQTMSQLVTSVLTVIGVLIVMFWISPLLAVIAIVSVPISVIVAARIGKKAQPQFIRQWSTTGKLN